LKIETLPGNSLGGVFYALLQANLVFGFARLNLAEKYDFL